MSKYKVILTVCEVKNISRAAELLNYTQSAVSQTIMFIIAGLAVWASRRKR